MKQWLSNKRKLQQIICAPYQLTSQALAMKYRAKNLFPFAICLAASAANAQQAASTAQMTMRVFMMACVPSNGSEEAIESAAKKLRLSELNSTDAERLLNGKSGRVWSTSDTTGRFMLSAQSPKTCSVMARGVNAEEMRKEFTSWLPPASSPFTVEKLADDTQGQVQIQSYSISREGKLQASWVIMTGQDKATVSVRAAQ